MSGGGGSSSDGGGGNDMQVSGAEAFYSSEPGISTAADTRVSKTSFSPGGGGGGGNNNQVDSADSQGNIVTTTIGYGEGQVDPKLAEAKLGADTSMVGAGAPTNSDREIERGYTDQGEQLANVNGKYMTKQQMYNTGIVQTDPNTGQEVMGTNTINPNTGELQKADMTFSEHWANAPDALKFSPTMRFLYASGKNIG